jgi:hypothetical protein
MEEGMVHANMRARGKKKKKNTTCNLQNTIRRPKNQLLFLTYSTLPNNFLKVWKKACYMLTCMRARDKKNKI